MKSGRQRILIPFNNVRRARPVFAAFRRTVQPVQGQGQGSRAALMGTAR